MKANFWAENRIYALLLGIVLVFSLAVPGFASWGNAATIFKGTAALALLAIGFTIVMICGQLDLSIAAVMVMGGMIAVKCQPQLGWPGSIALALCFGLLVGCINGFLVAKTKVDSFIATLGTLTILRGLSVVYSGGDSIQVGEYSLGRWLDAPLAWLPIFTPLVVVALLFTALIEFVLKRTTIGRGWFLVGGNAQTAWYSGLPVERLTIGAFALSGALSGLGGALYAILSGAATVRMGDTALMLVIAAVIVGGTAMSGGRGGVVRSLAALMALTILSNGFNKLGAGAEVLKIVSGLVLGGVILYDAANMAARNRQRGARHELLEEENENIEFEEDEMNPKKDSSLAIVCATALGCTAMVAIFAMFFIAQSRAPIAATTPAASTTTRAGGSTPATLASVDTSTLKASDGQLLLPPASPKVIPPRPKNPDSLPETDAGHWWDMEYAGQNLKHVNLPVSPKNGARGKKVIYLKFVDHPYLTAMSRGMKKVADAHGISLKTMVANGDVNLQAQQAEQAIQEKPDLVIVNPVDAKACVPYLRKMNEAGVPIIASNLLPINEAMQYVLAWTGPDDWAQMRVLARAFAKKMNYQGGYCIVRHFPGGSPYFARTFGISTELQKIAPMMKMLAMQSTELDANKTRPVVSGWIKRFGKELNGIVSADDSGTQIGINQACADAGRNDIVRAAAGNSKVGMDFVKAGSVAVINYQSPESDGALPMQLAADWFNGKPIPTIRYLPIQLITKENVAQFLPAQW